MTRRTPPQAAIDDVQGDSRPANGSSGSGNEAIQRSAQAQPGSYAANWLSRLRSVESMRPTVLVWRGVVLVVVLLGWELLVRFGYIDEFFLSRPSAVWAYLGDAVTSGDLFYHLSATLKSTVIGFLLGSVPGMLAGALLAKYRTLEVVARPFLTGLNSLPRVALGPVFILWFGLGPTAHIMLAVSLVFFLVMINTEAGILGVTQEWVTMAEVMGSSVWQVFQKVLLPGALPTIIAGLRLGLVYALLGVVVGELLAARRGIGQQIQYLTNTFNIAGVIGTLFALALLATMLNGTMMILQRRFAKWQGRSG